jgi:hypothetical protein
MPKDDDVITQSNEDSTAIQGLIDTVLGPQNTKWPAEILVYELKHHVHAPAPGAFSATGVQRTDEPFVADLGSNPKLRVVGNLLVVVVGNQSHA